MIPVSLPSKGQVDSARPLFEQALKIDPDNSEALAGKASTTFFEYVYAPRADIDFDAAILGPVDSVIKTDAAVVVCVGNPRNFTARRRIVERLGLPGDRYATVVHPSAVVGAGSTVGAGSVLLAGTVLTADVEVGAHVAVMPQAVLTHDDRVSDYATIASGVRLGGGAVLKTGAYVGSGALIREGVTVGEWALVGMGSVVLHDVPPGEVWAGNPARLLRKAEE